MRYLALIVNYNQDISKTQTFISLLKMLETFQDGLMIFIWDNLANIDNEEYVKNKLGHFLYKYVASGKNTPLCEIYNKVIYRDIKNFSHLIILDNDSQIEASFFHKLSEAVHLHPDINLLLPIVREKRSIISPAKQYFTKGVYFKKLMPGCVMSSRHITAINSGMVISTKYLLKEFLFYDKRLKFYGTDSYFMKIYRATNSNLFVLNVNFFHSLSKNVAESVDQKLFRHHDFKNGVRVVFGTSPIRKILVEIYLFIVSMKLVIKFRCLKFFI